MAGDEDQLAPVVGERVVEREPRALHAGQPIEPLLELAIERRELSARVGRRRPVQRHERRGPAPGSRSPGARACSRLRASIVAPATSTTDSVACTTSSAVRANDERSPVLRPAPRSASIGSVRVANQAGAAPKTMPVTSARPNANASTSGDGLTCRSAGTCAPREREREQQSRGADGDERVRRCPPATARRTLSTSACVTICRRDAPIARRTRGLAAPRDRAREQQVRDVGAGDEQHEPAHRRAGSAGCARTPPS